MKHFFKKKSSLWYVLGAVVAIGLLAWVLLLPDKTVDKLGQSKLMDKTGQHLVAKTELKTDEGIAVVTLKSGKTYETTYAASFEDELIKAFEKEGVSYKVTKDSSNKLFGVLIGLLPLVLLIGVAYFILIKGGSMRMKGYASNQDFAAQRPMVRFVDVMGADEAIEDLQPTVKALKDPDNYNGPPIIQGIMLHGPTGTGKTLLAKAIAGEAGTLFYHLSGPSVTGMFVNQSAMLVRNFFDTIKKDLAKRNTRTAVVFVDEFEGLAPKRRHGTAGEQERAVVVDQLLYELSELFDNYPFVVFVVATNLLELVDDAIARSGRLGRKIAMPNPDILARTKILGLNTKDIETEEDADLGAIAAMTDGMSGADMREVVQEARRVAYADGERTAVATSDLRAAVIRTAMGVPRKSAQVHPKDRAVTAIHESGHTLAALKSPYCQFQHVTILPIGPSGGSTWSAGNNQHLTTMAMLLDRVVMLLSGLAAEELLNPDGEPSAGASSDLQSATELAVSIVCQTSLGGIMQTIDPQTWVHHPMAGEVNEVVNDVLTTAKKAADLLMREHQAFLQALIGMLDEADSLDREQVVALYAKMEATA